MQLIFVLFVFAAAAVAQNICRDSAACCTVLNFQRQSDWNAVPWHNTDTVALSSHAFSAQGLFFSVAEIFSYTNQPYSLGLFNASKMQNSALTGSSGLASAGEDLVLSAFYRYPDRLLNEQITLHMNLNRQPACVAHVRVLRTKSFDERMSVEMKTRRLDALSGQYSDIQTYTSNWILELATNVVDHDFTSLHIDDLQVKIWGRGYGAIAQVEVCFSAPLGMDECGVCGGVGACAAPGNPCSTGMTAPGCEPGTFNAQMQCIPNRSGFAEVCNGEDDNCNGQVDEEMPLIWCGIGSCLRSISSCHNGAAADPNTCVPGAPVAEVCNALDDDCDGVSDNGDNLCASHTPSGSNTPSVEPTASTTPSASVEPSASVQPSENPVTNVLLVPRLTCIQPTTERTFDAIFGYTFRYMGASSSQDELVLDIGDNNLVEGSADASDYQPQPTHFSPQSASDHAFSVTFDSDSEVNWTLDTSAVGGARQFAIASVSSPRCGAVPFTLEPVQPIIDGCVDSQEDETASVRCTATMGYYNPNAQTIQINAGNPQNYFIADSMVGTTLYTPRPEVFFPGRVRNAFSVRFNCTHVGWSIVWHIETQSQAREVLLNSQNVCVHKE